MSFGFSSNMRMPVTMTLPGSAISDRTLMSQRASSVVANTVFTSATPMKSVIPRVNPVKPVETRLDDVHWVYATATQDVSAYTKPEGSVAAAGSRLLLLYPMREEKGGKHVTMRCKTVDNVTGQMDYTWILVYDVDQQIRHVEDFSFLP